MTVLVTALAFCFLGGALARLGITERGCNAGDKRYVLSVSFKAGFADRFGSGALRDRAIGTQWADKVTFAHHAVGTAVGAS